jgi:hypothetical protein
VIRGDWGKTLRRRDLKKNKQWHWISVMSSISAEAKAMGVVDKSILNTELGLEF